MTKQMFNLGSLKLNGNNHIYRRSIKLSLTLSTSQNEEIIKIKIFIS